MHIAIVSYTFPPSPGIGGRRWAKFSQELAFLGHDVSVLCAESDAPKGWYSQAYPNVNVSALPRRYPYWLSGQTRHFGEKLAYNLAVRIARYLLKGNIFDKGVFWRRMMMDALERLHGEKPLDVLVVTGAPFSTLAWGAEFKRKYPNVFYVADLRDPWSWGQGYGIADMNLKHKVYQEVQEKSVLESCDLVCFPSPAMGDILALKYPECIAKMYLLPHAYDPRKYLQNPPKVKANKFIYGGTLYNGIESWFRKLSEILSKNSLPDFQWEIFSGTDYPLVQELFPDGAVHVRKPVSEEALFGLIQQARAYMILFPEIYKDYISTKFYEVVYAGTPIVYIGYPGAVSQFIVDNHLGVHILPEEMDTHLPACLSADIPFESGLFPIDKFSFPEVTKEFLNELAGRMKQF